MMRTIALRTCILYRKEYTLKERKIDQRLPRYLLVYFSLITDINTERLLR